MKAFLAHSSTDKTIVESVANQLGRQFCLFDKYSFDTGEEFSVAIRRCLDQASVFVLFASRKSLEQVWVKYEIDEAYHRKLRQTISQSLVYIVDDLVSYDDLPDWLQDSVMRKEKSAKLIARDIRQHVDQLLRIRRQSYFSGRGKDLERLEELLTPTDGTIPPRAFLVHGLPGIGRRSLVRHSAENVLGFRKTMEIRLAEGDSINDLCAKIADLVESYSGVEEFNKAFAEIRALSSEEAFIRCLKNLNILAGAGELPIIIDEGGLLDAEGFMRATATQVLRGMPSRGVLYIAIVSHRKPRADTTLNLPMLPLNPLAKADCRRLLLRLFSDFGITVSPNDLNEIADYVKGYPPSAYFAVEQAKNYSVNLVVSHKHRLVEFRTGVFLKHIEKLGLDTTEGSFLQLLAAFSPIPIQSIVQALGVSLEKATETLISLIDLSLVIAEGDGLFRIADPIAEAASNVFGFPTKEMMKTVGISIQKVLRSSEIQHRYLELSRMLFRAARLSGAVELEIGVSRLSSDVIRLTEEYYHSRDYAQAIEFGRLAVTERPDSTTARGYLIRALAQQEMWAEANEELEKMEHHAPPKEVKFLRGFVLHRQGHLEEAINEFREARRTGRRGAAISRELSQCNFILGNMDVAMQELQEALRLHGDNRYVVDLWAQISTQQNNESEARKALDRLEVIDKPIFFYFRKSRVEWHFGHAPAATAAIQKAMELSHRPPFPVVAQSVLCNIASGNSSLARSHLQLLDNEFGEIRRDVRTGLRCRLEASEGNHTEALRLSERFLDKNSRYYLSIRAHLINELLKGSGITTQQREIYGQEFQEIRNKVGSVTRFDIAEIDNF